MDSNVPHIGKRGGSMRTRYFGKLEGITEKSKEMVVRDATEKGISIHDWLEMAVNEKIGKGGD